VLSLLESLFNGVSIGAVLALLVWLWGS